MSPTDLLKQINETRHPVIITQNGEARAVLQDPQSYENMRNAIGMLKLLSQGEADIRSGKSRSQEDVFKVPVFRDQHITGTNQLLYAFKKIVQSLLSIVGSGMGGPRHMHRFCS